MTDQLAEKIMMLARSMQELKERQPRFIMVRMSAVAWEMWGKYIYEQQEGLRHYLMGLLDYGEE